MVEDVWKAESWGLFPGATAAVWRRQREQRLEADYF